MTYSGLFWLTLGFFLPLSDPKKDLYSFVPDIQIETIHFKLHFFFRLFFLKARMIRQIFLFMYARVTQVSQFDTAFNPWANVSSF